MDVTMMKVIVSYIIFVMWNVICGNKLIDRKRKEQAQKKHLLALSKVRSSINNSTPREYNFLYTRPKANQLKYQRQVNIQNSNNILVSRMMKTNSYLKSQTDALLKDSLNSAYRSRKQREIDEGNQKLVKRLQSATSQYSCAQQYNREFDKYKINMAHSRMDPFYDFDSQTLGVPRKSSRPYSAKR